MARRNPAYPRRVHYMDRIPIPGQSHERIRRSGRCRVVRRARPRGQRSISRARGLWSPEHSERARTSAQLDTTLTQSTQAKKMSYKKPSDAELKKKLTPEQYDVTQQSGTEPPFRNEYWDNHEPGIYVDIVTGEPLFSSTDKFESGTGWPSFTKPLEPSNIKSQSDRTIGMDRTEIRSAAWRLAPGPRVR